MSVILMRNRETNFTATLHEIRLVLFTGTHNAPADPVARLEYKEEHKNENNREQEQGKRMEGKWNRLHRINLIAKGSARDKIITPALL